MKKLAIFDFDGTLFTELTVPYLFDRWMSLSYPKKSASKVKGIILKDYFLNKIGILSKKKFRDKATVDFLKLFSNMSEEEVIDFFEKACDGIDNHFNNDILNEIEKAKKEGYELVLVSGSFQPMLDAAMKNLGFNKIIGTKLPFKNNRMDFDKGFHIINGIEKKNAVLKEYENEEVDYDNSKAFADSYYDEFILKLTGNPVAVTPDSGLRKIAENEGWKII
jgi:HAD superfamily phosphoserine phosphatase-like hydrolase